MKTRCGCVRISFWVLLLVRFQGTMDSTVEIVSYAGTGEEKSDTPHDFE